MQEDERRRQRILQTYQAIGGIKATARKLKVSIHVVRRVLRAGLEPTAHAGVVRVPAARKSQLDAYKPMIGRMVLDDKLTAVLMLEELRRLGYAGGYSILKAYVRTIRPRPKVKVTTVLAHPPGVEGQVDWSPYTLVLGGVETVVNAFSLILPFSRYMWVRFALDTQLETLILLHQGAFDDIDGIPAKMTYDNMTTVGRHVSPEEIWLNPRFEQYAKEMDFDIELTRPGRPNDHASVERPMHYIEHNCLLRRRNRFADMADLNAHAKWWCDTVANVRCHGTTRERPVDRLVRERPFLHALPSQRRAVYRELSRTVGSDFCVAVDTNRYSVPPKCVGQEATVRLFAEHLEVIVAQQLVAKHVLSDGRYQRQVSPEHEAAFKLATPSRRLLEAAFMRLGPAAKDFYDGLRLQRGQGAGWHLQRILKLADRHGMSVVTGAMAHAARYGNYSAEAVARVISGRHMQARRSTQLGLPIPEPPERVRRWLEGLDVEQRDLADYDRLIDAQDPDDDDENPGGTDGA